eukprot:6210659-Amphidinium_carterae.1
MGPTSHQLAKLQAAKSAEREAQPQYTAGLEGAQLRVSTLISCTGHLSGLNSKLHASEGLVNGDTWQSFSGLTEKTTP